MYAVWSNIFILTGISEGVKISKGGVEYDVVGGDVTVWYGGGRGSVWGRRLSWGEVARI